MATTHRLVPFKGLSPPFSAAVARDDGVVIGAAFLVSPDTLVTCGHVVRDACGGKIEQDKTVIVRLSGDEENRPIKAHVLAILGSEPEHQSRDVALLRLPGAVEGYNKRAAPIVDRPDLETQKLRAFGFPDNSTVEPGGAMVGDNIKDLTILGKDGRDLVQLRAGDKLVHPGFSGAAVRAADDVVGMIVTSRDAGREAFMIPAELLTMRIQEAFSKAVIDGDGATNSGLVPPTIRSVDLPLTPESRRELRQHLDPLIYVLFRYGIFTIIVLLIVIWGMYNLYSTHDKNDTALSLFLIFSLVMILSIMAWSLLKVLTWLRVVHKNYRAFLWGEALQRSWLTLTVLLILAYVATFFVAVQSTDVVEYI